MQVFKITTTSGIVRVMLDHMAEIENDDGGIRTVAYFAVIDPAFRHRNRRGKATRMTRPAYVAFQLSPQFGPASSMTNRRNKSNDGNIQWWEILPQETVAAVTRVVHGKAKAILAAKAVPMFYSQEYEDFDPVG
jgi:hypothetical protein